MIRPELRSVSRCPGLETSPRVGALVLLPAVRWVDYSAWVLSCRTPSLRRYGPRLPVHYRLRPVRSGALWRVPTLDEVDTLSPADDCITRRNRLMANIPAAILRAVAANGGRHGLLPGTAR